MELLDQVTTFFSDFVDPKKRVFVGYLFLSIFIAFAWMFIIQRRRAGQAVKAIFDRKVFFSKSSIADYKIFFINRVFSLMISPLLVSQLAIATSVYFLLHNQSYIQPASFEGLNASIIVALFSFTLFVVDDFTKYLLHRWMHKFPMLWALHKVHHSAKTLTPITVYRIHPLEGVLYGLRGVVAQGSTLSIFYYLFGNAVDLYTVLGVNIIVFFFHVTGSNLRHSHIRIHYWRWLEYILISPAQHQLHHSIAEEHYDKNFGVALAVWDWLFGSLHLSQRDKELEFGIQDEPDEVVANLPAIYLRPFKEIYTIARQRFLRWGGCLMRFAPDRFRKSQKA